MEAEKGSRYKGLVLMLTGLLLLSGAIGLITYNLWDADRAERAAGEVRADLMTLLNEKKEADSKSDAETAYGFVSEKENYRSMPTEEIDGNSYIGIIEIPSMEISLPVMYEWDYERLRISPCRYSGSYYTGDLVICAHNYSKHFSPIRRLSIGADVYLTSVEGKTIHYEVNNIETVQPTDIKDMIENNKNSDSKNDWDLTLFTCNLGGQTRCAVRCLKISK